ncbi:HTH-type transcriptional regulator VqsM [Tistrella bauzanensis]|uniref:HTH-type transcriptional regulator VqsM n=1 Tax=Tistrella bauzanensis TaxID=657419 RepID=A0ABQ1IAC7_9PROT|nr:AraC family transcriptional regulator [Tistrella bauzanensis]GGB29175.1 HTH-type transcriptional regulator VqsM [Tistrella bauzanensis]
MTIPAGDRRDPVGVINILAMASERGVDTARLAATAAIDPSGLDAPGAHVLAWQELAMIEALVAALPGLDPAAAGLEAGLRYRVSAFGLFGWAMLTRPTLGDALSLWGRLPTLGLSFSAITVSMTPAALDFTLDDRPLHALAPPVHRFLVARGLVSTAVLVADLLGEAVRPDMARSALTLPRDPNLQDRFMAVLGPALIFDDNATARPAHRLRYSGDLPPRALPLAHPAATRAAERAFLAEAAHRGAAGPVAALKVLLRDVTDGLPPADLGTAARRLALSERSLRRRLAEAGTGFRQERDAALAERARRLLILDGLTVDATAARLGYADAAAFSRAFRRWTGDAPGRFARAQPRRSTTTASSTT